MWHNKPINIPNTRIRYMKCTVISMEYDNCPSKSMASSRQTFIRSTTAAMPISNFTKPFIFKKGGIFSTCYNELQDGVKEMSINELNPQHVRNNPQIHSGCILQEKNYNQVKDSPDKVQKVQGIDNNKPSCEESGQIGGIFVRDI